MAYEAKASVLEFRPSSETLPRDRVRYRLVPEYTRPEIGLPHSKACTWFTYCITAVHSPPDPPYPSQGMEPWRLNFLEEVVLEAVVFPYYPYPPAYRQEGAVSL